MPTDAVAVCTSSTLRFFCLSAGDIWPVYGSIESTARLLCVSTRSIVECAAAVSYCDVLVVAHRRMCPRAWRCIWAAGVTRRRIV